jgi:hypothetical protein
MLPNVFPPDRPASYPARPRGARRNDLQDAAGCRVRGSRAACCAADHAAAAPLPRRAHESGGRRRDVHGASGRVGLHGRGAAAAGVAPARESRGADQLGPEHRQGDGLGVCASLR